MCADASPHEPRLQRAKGDLVVTWRNRDGTTALADLRQDGCLKARFPRATGWAEAVLLNSSGGVAAGDTLTLRLAVGPNAHATFTAQAAERFYRARPGDAPATVHTTLAVAEGASAEWLPQETILFDACALHRTFDIDLAETSWFLGVETLVFGRTLMGETVHTAHLRDTIRLRRAGHLILHDAIRIDGPAAQVLAHPASTRGATCLATLIHAAPNAATHIPVLRAAWNTSQAEAPDSATLRATIVAGLAVLREARPLPRVWNC